MTEEIINEIEVKEQPSLTPEAENLPVVTISDVLARLWIFKYIWLIWICAGLAVGIIYIKGAPEKYTSSLKMMPESTDNSKTNASAALSALGMLDINNTKDAYSPSVYPEIVSSIPFITGLFDIPVQMADNDTTFTLRNYLTFHTHTPWWIPSRDSKERKFVKSDGEIIDPFQLTESEYDMYRFLSKNIDVELDRKTGQISVTVTMQDPLVAAQLTDSVAARLQEYITDYRTAKARNDLDYAIAINDEAQQTYYEAQQAYAEYMDRNQGLALYSAQTTRDRLQNDMQLAFNLYNKTSEKMQACEAKVQEETPVFAIVQPASVALFPSAPNKPLIVGGATFLFLVLGAVQIALPLFFTGRMSCSLHRQRSQLRDRREKRKLKFAKWYNHLLHRHRDGSEEEDENTTTADDLSPLSTSQSEADREYSIEEQEYLYGPPHDDDK